MFERYEFKNLLESFRPQAAHTPDFFAGEQKALSLQEVLDKAASAPEVFLYSEDDLFLFSVSEKEYALLPLADIQPWEADALKKLVFNDAVLKLGYDLKFTLRELDIHLQGTPVRCFDGRLARYVLDPSGDLSPAGAIAHYFSALVNGLAREYQSRVFYNRRHVFIKRNGHARFQTPMNVVGYCVVQFLPYFISRELRVLWVLKGLADHCLRYSTAELLAGDICKGFWHLL